MGSMLTEARQRLFDAAERAGLDGELCASLHYPRETLAASLKLRRDDGSLSLIKAWRCRYDDHLGPTKGGLRFHPSVNADEVQTLAFWMTVKCALIGLPFGGGKGGVQVDARDLSPHERERLTRAYADAFGAIIGPERDIPAPDVGTGATEMAWIMDAYAARTGRHAPGVITGKPPALGGLPGREPATGRGAFHVLEAMVDAGAITAENKTLAIQGFGAAGRHFAAAAVEAGWTIVAISDSRGMTQCADGLDLEAVKRAKAEQGTVAKTEGGDTADAGDILAVECDVLAPAALGGQITAETVDALNCKAIVELANGATTCAADAPLRERGIVAAPDILANAGGVFVSWLEWVQNRSQIPIAEDDVGERLKARMEAKTKAVIARAEELECDLRMAAYALAADRLWTAMRASGADAYA